MPGTRRALPVVVRQAPFRTRWRSALAIDTLCVVGVYATVADAKAHYELVGDLHTEALLVDAYDTVLRRREVTAEPVEARAR
jgi:hypothetical protein